MMSEFEVVERYYNNVGVLRSEANHSFREKMRTIRDSVQESRKAENKRFNISRRTGSFMSRLGVR